MLVGFRLSMLSGFLTRDFSQRAALIVPSATIEKSMENAMPCASAMSTFPVFLYKNQ